jgi:hypothetical protein
MTNKNRFLQIHQVKNGAYPLVTTIDSNVLSFDVILIADTYYVGAVQSQSGGSYKLVLKKLNKAAPTDNQISYSVENCGDQMKLTSSFVILSCVSYWNNKGIVNIYNIKNMAQIGNYTGGNPGELFGTNLNVIELF